MTAWVDSSPNVLSTLVIAGLAAVTATFVAAYQQYATSRRERLARERSAAAVVAYLTHDAIEFVSDLSITVATLSAVDQKLFDKDAEARVLGYVLSFPESLKLDLQKAQLLGPSLSGKLVTLRQEVEHFNRLTTLADRLRQAHGSLGAALKAVDREMGLIRKKG